jgi:WD repeat-containing protein 24
VAFEEGDEKTAETWLLLGASLTEYLPRLPVPLPKSPPVSRHKSPIPHSLSVPMGLPSSTYSFPSSASAPPGSSQLRKTSPSHASIYSTDSPHPAQARAAARSVSSSRKMTPASSKSSSPRQATVGLPPNTSRRRSVFGGRDTLESEFLRRGSISLLRRPSISMSTLSVHSVSPGEKIGGGSLRHVGEGALDDSDSSGSGSAGDATGDDQGSSDGEQALPSPGLLHTRTMPTPSPLSRVAGRQHWTEDEEDGEGRENNDEDDASPSPGSTDTDSSYSSSPPRRRKSSSSNSNSKSRRQAKQIKSRSRSSTVALLAAPVPPRLTHQYSSSSIRTVTAAERELERDEHGLKGEGTFRDVRETVRAQARSELGVDSVIENGNGVETRAEMEVEAEDIDAAKLTDRLLEVIRGDEKRFRELAWDALREALEGFADEVCVCVIACHCKALTELSGRRPNVCHASVDCACRTPNIDQKSNPFR